MQSPFWRPCVQFQIQKRYNHRLKSQLNSILKFWWNFDSLSYSTTHRWFWWVMAWEACVWPMPPRFLHLRLLLQFTWQPSCYQRDSNLWNGIWIRQDFSDFMVNSFHKYPCHEFWIPVSNSNGFGFHQKTRVFFCFFWSIQYSIISYYSGLKSNIYRI